jgi:hypothetical protein
MSPLLPPPPPPTHTHTRYNRARSTGASYGVAPESDATDIPVIFPVHSFDDSNAFSDYFFDNAATFLANLSVTRVPPDTDLGGVLGGAGSGGASSQGKARRGKPCVRELAPGSPAVGDKLEFLGVRVYAVDVSEDIAASGATLRVEVAGSVPLHLRVKKGRPPTRFTSSTAAGKHLGNSCYGVSVGARTKPALTAGRWFIAVSAVAPVQCVNAPHSPVFMMAK